MYHLHILCVSGSWRDSFFSVGCIWMNWRSMSDKRDRPSQPVTLFLLHLLTLALHLSPWSRETAWLVQRYYEYLSQSVLMLFVLDWRENLFNFCTCAFSVKSYYATLWNPGKIEELPCASQVDPGEATVVEVRSASEESNGEIDHEETGNSLYLKSMNGKHRNTKESAMLSKEWVVTSVCFAHCQSVRLQPGLYFDFLSSFCLAAKTSRTFLSLLILIWGMRRKRNRVKKLQTWKYRTVFYRG